MSNLTDLVPPLELCKLIPAGEFEDSVCIYVFDPYCEEWDFTLREDKDSSAEAIPAPTLQEIMAEIPFAQGSILANGSFIIHPRFGKERNVRCHDDNAATAAMKLWLKLKGIDYEQKQS